MRCFEEGRACGFRKKTGEFRPASGGPFHTDGTVLRSYAEPIAYRHPETGLVFSLTEYTNWPPEYAGHTLSREGYAYGATSGRMEQYKGWFSRTTNSFVRSAVGELHVKYGSQHFCLGRHTDLHEVVETGELPPPGAVFDCLCRWQHLPGEYERFEAANWTGPRPKMMLRCAKGNQKAVYSRVAGKALREAARRRYLTTTKGMII